MKLKKVQSKPKMIYKDEFGNKIYRKYIKSRDIYQNYAKNNEGKIVDLKGFKEIAKKAGLKVPRGKGIKVSKTVSKFKYTLK